MRSDRPWAIPSAICAHSVSDRYRGGPTSPAREDAIHAIANHHPFVPEFDEPRVAGAGRPDLYIGPPRQLGGELIEVMVERIPPRDLVIFHVMPARQKFLDLLNEGE